MDLHIKKINGFWTLNEVPYKLLRGIEKFIFERLLHEILNKK